MLCNWVGDDNLYTCSGEMLTMYGMRLESGAHDEQQKKKKKCADLSALPKIDMALWRNADFDSKPCVLQHFGFPPFSSITSKYCKGYKFQKKGDFKMLKNHGVVPGPVTLFFQLLYQGNEILFHIGRSNLQMYDDCQ